jgi:hypothetical protein
VTLPRDYDDRHRKLRRPTVELQPGQPLFMFLR